METNLQQEEYEDEVFTGEVLCSDCKKLLCNHGLALEQYYEYNGTPEREREDTDDIMWMICYDCWMKNDALNRIEMSGNIPEELEEDIRKRHRARQPTIFPDCPGLNYFGAYYKKDRKELVERRCKNAKTWMDIIDSWDPDKENRDWFDTVMEIPNSKDNRYATEIQTIRIMIRLGWNYKERLFRHRRYWYRQYGPGEVANFHRLVKMGCACINCGGAFPAQYSINPDWQGIACGDCTNESTLQLSINQNIGLIAEHY